MKINWLMIVPLAIIVGLFGVFGYRLANNQDALQQGIDTTAIRSVQEGRPAPALNLTALDGTALLTRADLEGNGLVIVNYFASWCPPCRAEHPTLTALAQAGNQLFGVNYRDPARDALGFLNELGNPYARIGQDAEARNGRDWGVVAMPETFFINDDGIVVLHFRGPITQRSLENQVIPALAEAGYALEPIATPAN